MDTARAEAIVAALRQAGRDLGIPGDVDLALLTRLPDVLRVSRAEVTPEPRRGARGAGPRGGGLRGGPGAGGRGADGGPAGPDRDAGGAARAHRGAGAGAGGGGAGPPGAQRAGAGGRRRAGPGAAGAGDRDPRRPDGHHRGAGAVRHAPRAMLSRLLSGEGSVGRRDRLPAAGAAAGGEHDGLQGGRRRDGRRPSSA